MSEDPLSFTEYLFVSHELNKWTKDLDIMSDNYMNLSDFIPESRSLQKEL